MIERTSDGEANVKLIDFGLARSLTKGELMYSKVGSLRYMAFEILSSCTRGYGVKCDLWSMGVNLFILCTANSPWNSKSEYGILKEMKTQIIDYDQENWKAHPPQLILLTRKLLIMD